MATSFRVGITIFLALTPPPKRQAIAGGSIRILLPSDMSCPLFNKDREMADTYKAIGYLKKLEAATDEILKAIKPGDISGAINWSDLCCTDVRKWFNQDGEEGVTILIEEASPEAYELQQHVRSQIYEMGLAGQEVEVRTEW